MGPEKTLLVDPLFCPKCSEDIQYVSWREIRLLALAPTAGTLTLIAVYLLVSRLPFVWLRGVPRSVIGIDWLITLLGIGSIRWIAHSVLRRKEMKISDA